MKPTTAFLPVLIPILFFTGCVVTQEVFLQEVTIKGPMPVPTVRLAADSAGSGIRITPRISVSENGVLNARIERHTPVNQSGVFQVDTVYSGDEAYLRETPNANTIGYTGRNLRWRMPKTTVGLDVELPFSRSVALTLGVAYADLSNESFWGWNAGLGFHGGGRSVAFRFDAGLHWTTLAYEVFSVVKTTVSGPFGHSEHVGFFPDRGKQSRFGYYLSITLHGNEPDCIVNPFLSIGLSRISAFNYRPSRSFPLGLTEASTDATYGSSAISLSPGIFFPLTDMTTLIVGVRRTSPGDMENTDTKVLITPFVQMVLAL